MASAEHSVGGGGPAMESDINFGGIFTSILGALFLFTLIKHATGNPTHGEGGGHGGGHHQ